MVCSCSWSALLLYAGAVRFGLITRAKTSAEVCHNKILLLFFAITCVCACVLVCACVHVCVGVCVGVTDRIITFKTSINLKHFKNMVTPSVITKKFLITPQHACCMHRGLNSSHLYVCVTYNFGCYRIQNKHQSEAHTVLLHSKLWKLLQGPEIRCFNCSCTVPLATPTTTILCLLIT